MRQLRPLFATLVIVSSASACASSGTTLYRPDVPKSTTIQTASGSYTADIRNSADAVAADLALPIQHVWLALPQVYDDIGLTDGGALPDGHAYGVRDKRIFRIAGKRLDEYLDCGNSIEGPRANIYEVRITSMTQLAERAGGTHVETIVQATAKPRGTSGNPVTCRSRGVLEPLIAQRLSERAG